jgi:hypothetical protein
VKNCKENEIDSTVYDSNNVFVDSNLYKVNSAIIDTILKKNEPSEIQTPIVEIKTTEPKPLIKRQRKSPKTSTEKLGLQQRLLDGEKPKDGYIFIGAFSQALNKFVSFVPKDNKKRELSKLEKSKEITIKRNSSVYDFLPKKKTEMSDVIYIADKNQTFTVISISKAYTKNNVDLYYVHVKF